MVAISLCPLNPFVGSQNIEHEKRPCDPNSTGIRKVFLWKQSTSFHGSYFEPPRSGKVHLKEFGHLEPRISRCFGVKHRAIIVKERMLGSRVGKKLVRLVGRRKLPINL